MKTYPLIVIGAGSGGLVAAQIAAKLGISVALVEKNERLGGECLHAGCVPSKALIAAARYADSPRKSRQLGVELTATVDFQAVKAHIQGSIHAIEEHSENDEFYRQLGVDVYHGAAHFIDGNTIEVNGEQLTGKKFILATGSSPSVPPVSGLDGVPYVTNETVFDMPELPKRLLVIGGGPIGCELGQAFQQLGSSVTIVQHGDRILPREEVAVSDILQQEFTAIGLSVLVNAEIASLSKTADGISASVQHGDQTTDLVVDTILVAAGRTPNTDLDLEKAGIKKGDRGIVVNDRLQTSNSAVYAIGDCIGQYQFTHYAAEQAGLAVRNALFPLSGKQPSKAVPWVTFTEPEIGRIGAIEDELKSKNTAYKLNSFDYAGIDKAVVEKSSGVIRILSDPKDDKILGATVVGENAGEIINQIAMVYALERPFTDLGSGLRAYPNYSFGLKQLAADALIDKAAKNPVVKLLRPH